MHVLVVAVEEICWIGKTLRHPELKVAGLEPSRGAVHETLEETPNILLDQTVNLVTLSFRDFRGDHLQNGH